ncbi:MAG: Crp/Fnr family transcriptional regulator [Xanthomonadaceae bacterium]|nr:Crp/Fnr family transcriptional regulator [Xanthomonadaceae bacterium]MDP2186288.1 Crp/Fnr family transcriptional regulator [Xanthomonadales bacterium]MDZ4115321.1 Crp/Fnr family transcriptional regulator [Xanthomonadaceae bacterium]MDZ4377055.1 Crp/Fnr family transcriptional regulator [Xanthomonadaceae bacterium]
MPKNLLLEALPADVSKRLHPHLELVPLALGEVLYESGDTMRHVYFPTDAIVSLLYVMVNGASGEIAVVGREGVVGIALFMGGESTPSRALVQSAGNAWRLPGHVLKDEFHRHTELQYLLLRYTQALITQMAQTAVCNRHHSIDQQLCRWLLLSLDRLPSNQSLRVFRFSTGAVFLPSTAASAPANVAACSLRRLSAGHSLCGGALTAISGLYVSIRRPFRVVRTQLLPIR